MSSDEINEINEAPAVSYAEELAQLRDTLKTMKAELEAKDRDIETLRSENRKLFYDTIKTGVPDQPAEPEPVAIPTVDELARGFGDIIKDRR